MKGEGAAHLVVGAGHHNGAGVKVLADGVVLKGLDGPRLDVGRDAALKAHGTGL